MSDFSVHRYGSDAYGRPVYMTAYMHEWFEEYVDDLGWRPRIAQGAFMARVVGGGAEQSSGAHDAGGCLDLITDGCSVSEIDHMVNTARRRGAGAYRRDRTVRHGSMPPHMHLTLGTDRPLSPMAQTLWSSYLAGGDGLAAADGRPANAPDYEWRPNPLVTTPPEDWFEMATKADLKAAIREVLTEDGLVEAPPNDSEFGGGDTSVVAALKRIWRKVGA
jgi:hypothetical protein